MDKKYWYVIIGVGIILVFLLFRSFQPSAAPAESPQAPTLAPALSATPTPRPQLTNTPVMTTAVPTISASATSRPQPTTPPVPTQNPIQGINWLWLSVKDQPTGEVIYVPNPTVYTIIFHTDGTVSGQADCNTYTGTYSQQGGLTIKIKSSTRAACAEGSLDQQYLVLLDQIVAGGPDGSGGLALETAGGEKRMEFQNGGLVPN